jgi:hypothetical protein
LTACFMGSRPHGLSKSASEGAVSGVEVVCVQLLRVKGDFA